MFRKLRARKYFAQFVFREWHLSKDNVPKDVVRFTASVVQHSGATYPRIKVSGQTATPQSRKLFYCSSSENHSLLVRRANGAEYKSNATTDTSFVWQQQQQRRSVHTSIRLQKHVVSVFPFNFQLEHCNELFQFVGCPSLYPCSNFFFHNSLLHRKTWSPATDIPLRRTT